ncbi:myogenesis-regulating glycosidase-like [Mytilus galloprovincialis]|uniref:myogenesis-regulating glycosidase-like n=1 Tax=Mytilus galloprovincialis TaxID=29158 RepID=UPI003F7C099B
MVFRWFLCLLLYLLEYVESDSFCTKDSCQSVRHDALQNKIIFEQDTLFAEIFLPSILKKSRSEISPPSDDSSLSITWPRYGSVVVNQEMIGEVGCQVITWTVTSLDFEPHDCISLADAYWYGGSELHYQRWPFSENEIELQEFVSEDVVVIKGSFGNVLEPFWINSNGVAIFVDQLVPLHVSFNSSGSQLMCFKAKYSNALRKQDDDYPTLKYTVCKDKNILTVFQKLRQKIMDKPQDIPDLRMIKSPIWSTWAKYKVDINQEKILRYANEINEYGFSNSQIEIDDMYSTKYGDLNFDSEKFHDPIEMIKQLKQKGFRVTVWITPFANLDSKAFTEGTRHNYWLRDLSGKVPALVQWWQGIGAIIDPSNPNATSWYNNRLQMMKENYGIDSFKFDAGERTFIPIPFSSHQIINNPNIFATKYVEMVSNHGNLIEVRCGYKSQKHPIFVRMADKESRWGYENGLKTIIPSALTFGILGYPFVLPDMIGGNGYGEVLAKDIILPDRELYIRWLQLTAYLPSMQFSFTPWDYDKEVIEIAHSMIRVHETVVTPLLLSYAEKSMQHGYPLIRAMWWIAPDDKETYNIDSQFMVGNTLMVAPILDPGARQRDIYFPKGTWRDNLNGQNIDGGRWIKNYQVLLDQIATFDLL